MLVTKPEVFGVDKDWIVAGLSLKTFLKFSVRFCVSSVVTLQSVLSALPLRRRALSQSYFPEHFKHVLNFKHMVHWVLLNKIVKKENNWHSLPVPVPSASPDDSLMTAQSVLSAPGWALCGEHTWPRYKWKVISLRVLPAAKFSGA